MSGPNGFSENKKLTTTLSQRFPNRSVIIFEDKENILVRLDGEMYYVELMIDKRLLGKNPVEVIERFYNAALGKLKKEATILTDTQ